MHAFTRSGAITCREMEKAWTSNERERKDARVNIVSAFPGLVIIGDYVIEGSYPDFIENLMGLAMWAIPISGWSHVVEVGIIMSTQNGWDAKGGETAPASPF